MQEPFKYCSACGAQNNLSAQFCQACGVNCGGMPPPPIAQARPKRSATVTVLLVIVVGFFGCCAIGVLMRSNKTPARASLENPPTSAVSRPLWSPTPDLPPAELLSRAKQLLAQPYDRSAYDGAMDLLNRIPSEAKEYKASIPLKQKITKAREREQAIAEAAARKIGAENVERGMLSKGYDVTVSVSGPGNRTIKITWVLMSRPLVYQLVEGGMLNQLRSQGFRKVIFSDGYGRTWWYEL